jgi:uncharacterized membrane protein YqjE
VTAPHPDDSRAARAEDLSLGQLVGELTGDLQKLFRQELELARVELKAEAAKAGKAAGMLGGAGFAGYMVAVLLSFAVVFGLANVMDLGWSALIVAVVWGIAGAIMFTLGRARMRTVSPKPQQTVDTLKEDAQWARHPSK